MAPLSSRVPLPYRASFWMVGSNGGVFHTVKSPGGTTSTWERIPNVSGPSPSSMTPTWPPRTDSALNPSFLPNSSAKSRALRTWTESSETLGIRTKSQRSSTMRSRLSSKYFINLCLSIIFINPLRWL